MTKQSYYRHGPVVSFVGNIHYASQHIPLYYVRRTYNGKALDDSNKKNVNTTKLTVARVTNFEIPVSLQNIHER